MCSPSQHAVHKGRKKAAEIKNNLDDWGSEVEWTHLPYVLCCRDGGNETPAEIALYSSKTTALFLLVFLSHGGRLKIDC